MYTKMSSVHGSSVFNVKALHVLAYLQLKFYFVRCPSRTCNTHGKGAIYIIFLQSFSSPTTNILPNQEKVLSMPLPGGGGGGTPRKIG